MKINFKLMAAAIVFLAACKKENVSTQSAITTQGNVSEAMVQENGNNPDETMLIAGNKLNANGHVYLESNDAGGNVIMMYGQQLNGKLSWSSSTNSGGNGSGAGLGSESAIAINKDYQLLFAVNAGSNSVSSFKIKSDGSLELKSTIGSGGTLPVSVCTWNNLVYVVNSTTANISGYTVDADGNFEPINNSKKDLSAVNALPAQIAFSPDGKALLVTEKMTSMISTFSLDANGAVTGVTYTKSVGVEPFGFDFSRDQYMIVSNAFNGAPNASTCTSYSDLSGNIHDVNGSVPNHQSASCWVTTTKYGRYAFVTNAASNNIATYYVNPSGAIYYLPWSVTTAGKGPIDITVSENNLFVYNINSGDHSITEFMRSDAGALRAIGSITSIPSFAAGLIAD